MNEAINSIVDGVKSVTARIDTAAESNESRAACLRQLSETLVNLYRLKKGKIDNE